MKTSRHRRVSPIERLESKSVLIPFSGCRIWFSGSVPAGYGVMWFEGRQQYSHRVAWQIKNGEIPDGMHVLHRCDTPSCVNEDHLFLGTPSDNTKDMMNKGRGSFINRVTGKDHHMYLNGYKGEANGRSKLTQDKVDKIRELYKPGVRQADLASMFGVGQTQISEIIRRSSWA